MKHFISLGAGVQSSTMALMASAGEITPMPDGAIFADTQAEPESVYRWLDWLEPRLKFPVFRITKGNMEEEMLMERERVKKSDGLSATWARNLIPTFVINSDGTVGKMGRQCTTDYKVRPIEAELREIAAIKRGEKEVKVVSWIGISTDEAHRMKPSRQQWIENRWPLIEKRMSRGDCLAWMEKNGFPNPPRSACVFCPYHNDAEWSRLKADEPEAFDRAVRFELTLQAVKIKTYNFSGKPFLHRSCVSLDAVDLGDAAEHGQADMFGEECEGLCGV